MISAQVRGGEVSPFFPPSDVSPVVVLGTSSKSTKLVHGGVRYLQKAVFELDYEQYKLVKEALHERKIFLQTAPYLSNMLPIMLPLYKCVEIHPNCCYNELTGCRYWQVPYYWIGCKMYDLLAGKENMETSYLMTKGKALEAFPMLKSDGLVGALVYYDGTATFHSLPWSP